MKAPRAVVARLRRGRPVQAAAITRAVAATGSGGSSPCIERPLAAGTSWIAVRT
jgi:hypothetical protein